MGEKGTIEMKWIPPYLCFPSEENFCATRILDNSCRKCIGVAGPEDGLRGAAVVSSTHYLPFLSSSRH